jgi:hypothetical protein
MHGADAEPDGNVINARGNVLFVPSCRCINHGKFLIPCIAAWRCLHPMQNNTVICVRGNLACMHQTVISCMRGNVACMHQTVISCVRGNVACMHQTVISCLLGNVTCMHQTVISCVHGNVTCMHQTVISCVRGNVTCMQPMQNLAPEAERRGCVLTPGQDR